MPKPTPEKLAEMRANGPIRLACGNCFRDDCDGVKEIPPEWQDVSERQSLEDALTTYEDEEDGPPPKGYSVLDWWTHIGTCPECAKSPDPIPE